jgi:hypothetical protein
LIIASGIVNIYARDATATRHGQHTLAKLYDGRFLLGLGVYHVLLVENARGHQYRQPVATMRAYSDTMDKAAAIAPPLDEPPLAVLAALGPQMTALVSRFRNINRLRLIFHLDAKSGMSRTGGLDRGIHGSGAASYRVADGCGAAATPAGDFTVSD